MGFDDRVIWCSGFSVQNTNSCSQPMEFYPMLLTFCCSKFLQRFLHMSSDLWPFLSSFLCLVADSFMIYLLFNHPLRDLWLTNAKLLSNNTLGSTLLITCFNYLNFELSSICMTLFSSLLFCSTVFCYSSISMFY